MSEPFTGEFEITSSLVVAVDEESGATDLEDAKRIAWADFVEIVSDVRLVADYFDVRLLEPGSDPDDWRCWPSTPVAHPVGSVDGCIDPTHT